MGDNHISSRTPEGPLNFCVVCDTHCRIEPSHTTNDATCPRCGSLLWFIPSDHIGTWSERGMAFTAPSELAARYWEPWTCAMFGMKARPFLSTEDVLNLENQLGIQLPQLLARALSAQNGGRL